MFVLLFSSCLCLFTNECVTAQKAACLHQFYFELINFACLGVGDELIKEGIEGNAGHINHKSRKD